MTEPPAWSVVGIKQPSGPYLVLQRQPTIRIDDAWFIAGDVACKPHTWAEVCAFGTPVLMVPDPALSEPKER